MQFSQAELHIPHPQVQLGKERLCGSELMLTVIHACTHTQSLQVPVHTGGPLLSTHLLQGSYRGPE